MSRGPRAGATGFGTLTTETGDQVVETYTCCHCNTVHDKPAKNADGSTDQPYCHNCWKPVCPACHARGECTPFEKTLDEFQRVIEKRVQVDASRHAFFREMGLE